MWMWILLELSGGVEGREMILDESIQNFDDLSFGPRVRGLLGWNLDLDDSVGGEFGCGYGHVDVGVRGIRRDLTGCAQAGIGSGK